MREWKILFDIQLLLGTFFLRVHVDTLYVKPYLNYYRLGKY